MHQLIDYSYPFVKFGTEFTGNIDHSLHQRVLRLPTLFLARCFNRSHEVFYPVPLICEPCEIMAVELGSTGDLQIRLVDGRTAYVPFGQHWVIDLLDPYGTVVGKLTPEDYPDCKSY